MRKIFLLIITVIWAVQLSAQVTRIKGTVTDQNGVPLPGATVKEQKTTNGVLTDVNGNYTISLRNPKATLVVSYIGYTAKDVPVTSSTVNVQLESDIISLGDVVVVGYGAQKKASVVGAISTARAGELKQMGTPNLSNALAGRVSGLVAMVASGRPGGDDAEIYIRGVATLNSANSKPLILVDGVERDYTQLDPDDVESFSVLKDASATAVYGVRGANGVLLITTKRGEIGKATISVSYKATLQQPTRLMKYLPSYESAILRNRALANDGIAPKWTDAQIEHFRTHDMPYTYPDNDYLADFMNKYTPMHNINVSVSGGTDRLKYYVSTNGMFQDGIYKQFKEAKFPSNANFKRLNIRSNLDFEATKTTTISLDLNSRVEQQQNIGTGDITSSGVFTDMNLDPPWFYAYRLPNGSYGGNATSNSDNLLALLNDSGYNRLLNNILEGTFRVNQKLDIITKGLSFRGMVSFNSYFERGTKVGNTPPTFVYNEDGTYAPVTTEVSPWLSVVDGAGHSKRTNMEYSLNYSRTFGDHAVTAMALYTQTQSNSNQDIPKGFLGYVGRLTYGFKNKYLAEFNFGYNGSDQFDKSHRYGFFPSTSLGWVASEEGFIKNNLPAISFLKFRGSYGEVGNDKIGTDRFLYLQTFTTSKVGYFFGTDASWGEQKALYEGTLGNNNVTWEIGKKSNLGFDLKMFKNKFFVNLDLFREMRVNIFTTRNTTPILLGVDMPNENIGKVENKGFELEAGTDNKIGEVAYHIRGMVSFNKNTVIYQDEVTPRFDYLRRTGQSVGQNFGQTVIGYYVPDDFQKDANGNMILQANGKPILLTTLPQPTFQAVQPGDFKYWDRNGDGVIDTFDAGPIGHTRIPSINFSISYGLNYKGFDFNMMWQGAGGNDRFLSGYGVYEMIRDVSRYRDVHLYAWTLDRYLNNEKILYPRLSSAKNNNNHIDNTYWLAKGDYIRLKNIELGYNIPKKTLSKFKISNMRVYFSGTNVLTFDYLKIMDPESNSSDGTNYPQMILWNLGFNIQF